MMKCVTFTSCIGRTVAKDWIWNNVFHTDHLCFDGHGELITFQNTTLLPFETADLKKNIFLTAYLQQERCRILYSHYLFLFVSTTVARFSFLFFLLETIRLCFVILFLFVSTYFDSIGELIFWIGLLVWLVLMKCATFTSCTGLTHTRASWIRNTASPKVLLITTGLLRDVWQTFQLMRKPPKSGQFWK